MGFEKHRARYEKRAAKEAELAQRKKIRTAAMTSPVPREKLPPRRQPKDGERQAQAGVQDKWTICPKCEIRQLAEYRKQHVCSCGYSAPVKGELLNRPETVGGYGSKTGG